MITVMAARLTKSLMSETENSSSAPLIAVEFGSNQCPTCKAFRSIWDGVQERISIPTKSYYLENPDDYDIMVRDRTGDEGIPALWIYGSDKPVGLVYAYDVDDGEYFPSVDELATKVCRKVHEAGGDCTVKEEGKERIEEKDFTAFPNLASASKVKLKNIPTELALESSSADDMFDGPDASIWLLPPSLIVCCVILAVIITKRRKKVIVISGKE